VDLLRVLKHGAQAGGVAGLVTGGFGYLLAEPVMDRAVGLESARETAEQADRAAAGLTAEHHTEVFSRSTQHLGLLVAALATGLALGVLFAVAHALLHRDDDRPRDDGPSRWRTSLWLAAGAF